MRIPRRTLRSRTLAQREARRGNTWLRATTALLCLGLMMPLAAASEPTRANAAGESSYSSVPMQSWRLNGVGRSILKVGSTIYVGGTFTEAISPDGTQRVSRRNLAAFDARTGALIPSFRADADNAVYNIQIDANTLYVGGVFTSIGGVSRARLAAIDATTGAVRSGFSADTNGNVYNLSLAGGKLYVGGVFTTIGGLPRTRGSRVADIRCRRRRVPSHRRRVGVRHRRRAGRLEGVHRRPLQQRQRPSRHRHQHARRRDRRDRGA